MQALLLIGVGAAFTVLSLVLPVLHVARLGATTLPPATVVFLSVPVAALVAAALRPRPWLTVGLFPASHLPGLALEPALDGVGPFGGPTGLLAFVAVASVFAAWLALAWRAAAPPGLPVARDPATAEVELPVAAGHALPVLSLAFALGCFGAFAAAALAEPELDREAASITVIVGAVAAWYAVARVVVGRLGVVLLEPRALRRAVAALFVERPRHPATAPISLLVAGLALLGALLWYAL